MPRILSAALTQEKNRLESDHPFAMLFQLEIENGPGTYRIAGYDQDIVFGGQLFLRAPLDVDLLEEATSMALVHLRVTTNNVDQEFISLLENYWAPVADPLWTVTVWQIDAAQPDSTPFESGEQFSVLSVTTDFVSASIDLVAEGLTLGTILPRRRYTTSGGFDNIPFRA
jgi:hypothetical protein